MDRKIQQGEEGPRSGTKKRCSHNLHDLVSGYLQSSFSQRKYFRSEKRTGRENNSIIEKNTTMPLCFTPMSYLSFGSELAKRKRQSLQPCKFATVTRA